MTPPRDSTKGRDSMKQLIRWPLPLLSLLVLLLAPGLLEAPLAAAPADPPPPPARSLAGTPGHVDFAELGLEISGEQTLRVALHGSLLRLVAGATRQEEPGFAELIEKLQGITATLYEVDPGARKRLQGQMARAARTLEGRGWQTALEMRQDGALSILQLRTDGEAISGLSVLFVDADGTAGTINVVGNVTPEEIGRLGRTFKIESLERFEDDGKP